jgi:hypothetical protein
MAGGKTGAHAVTLALYLTPGGFAVLERAGVPVRLPRVQQAMLNALASDPERRFGKGELEDAIWQTPFRSPDTAAKSIDVQLYRLRRAAGPEVVETQPRGVRKVGQRGRDGGAIRLGSSVTVHRFGDVMAGDAAWARMHAGVGG